MFNSVGVVVDVYLSKKKRRNSNTMFGFVRFRREEECLRAIKELNGKTLLGEKVKVSWARFDKENAKKTEAGTVKERRIIHPALRDQRQYKEVVLGMKRQRTVEQDTLSKQKGVAFVNKENKNAGTGGGQDRAGFSEHRKIEKVTLNLSEIPTMKNTLKLAVVVEFEPPTDCKRAGEMITNMHMASLLFFSAISPLKLVLFFEDTVGMDSAIGDSSPLRKAFTKVRKWSEKESIGERAVWLECSGLHPYCWSEENLMKIGDIWGKTIKVVDVFNGIHSITTAKLLVLTKRKEVIDKRVHIITENGSGVVMVKETHHCACTSETWGNDGENDNEMEDDIVRLEENEVVAMEDAVQSVEEGEMQLTEVLKDDVQGLSQRSNLHGHGKEILCSGVDHEVGHVGDQCQITIRENDGDVESFDPSQAVDVPSVRLMTEGGFACSVPILNHSAIQKRPRGRPKRVIQSLPEPLYVPSTPSNGMIEASETWNTAKRIGVKARNEGVVLSTIRKSKRLLARDGLTPSEYL